MPATSSTNGAWSDVLCALLRRGTERHPLLWTALLAVAAVLVADGLFWTGGLAAILVLLPLWQWRRYLAAGALTLAILAGSMHLWRVDRQRHALEESSSLLEAAFTVASPPRPSARGWTALANGPGGALWWFRGQGDPPLQGERISAGGHFQPLQPARNPGQFDAAGWLWRKGASGTFEARTVHHSLAPPGWLARQTTWLRHSFSTAITQGMPPESPEAMVIRAMILGEAPADPGIVEPFRTSGALHAFSVSGMHVAMLGAIGWLFLRIAGVPRRISIFFLIAGMAVYVWVTGSSPPAVRALTMASLVLAGFFLRRRGSLANVLGVALLLAVMADGHLIFQPGVQLSFGVVAAIAFWTSFTSRPFLWIAATEPYLPRQLYGRYRRFSLWCRTWLASTLGMSTSATLGSLPLLVWHFGLVSPVSIIVSVVMGPVIFVLMVLAFASAALSFMPPVSRTLNVLNASLARTCIVQARVASAVPFGHFQVPLDRPGSRFMTIYDPGYGGGAAVFHDGGAATVLFDAGSDSGFQHLLAPSLQRMAVIPQALVLSHPDAGHTDGAVLALSAFSVRQALVPVLQARSPGYRDFLAAAPAHGTKIIHPRQDQVFPLSPDASLEILRVAGPELENAAADERVMITRLHWRGWRILFTSDAGWTTERALLSSGLDLRADVVVMGRHGRDSSGSDAFLDAVRPRAIIAGHADFPAGNRIPAPWQAAVTARGIILLHQGQTGAVHIIPQDDGALELRGFVDGSRHLLGPSPGGP